jgi:hydrogenase nickel incorporation protein HypA/HybF
MHELSITQELLGLAVKHAVAAGGGRVTALSIAIGDLSTFSEDAVGFCWEALARGTQCEGARLQFRRVPGQLTCRDCGDVHTLRRELAPCPRCGSHRLKVTGGNDLVLETIEVESDADAPSTQATEPNRDDQ